MTSKKFKKQKPHKNQEDVAEAEVEEFIIVKSDKYNVIPLTEELDTAKITEIDFKKVPDILQAEDVSEGEEIVEVIETPEKKVVKKKKKTTNKEEVEKLSEEITDTPLEDTFAMNEQQVVEIVKTPTKKAIYKKKAQISEDNLLEEDIEEIIIDKLFQQKAKPFMEHLDTAEITEIDVKKVPEILQAEDVSEGEEIVEVIETPEKKIVKKKKKTTKKEEVGKLIEEITDSPLEDTVAINEQHIAEIIETLTKEVIHKKKDQISEDNVPEEVIEKIVIENPYKQKAIPLSKEEESVLITIVNLDETTSEIKVENPKNDVLQTTDLITEMIKDDIVDYKTKPKKANAKKKIIPEESLITVSLIPQHETKEIPSKDKDMEESLKVIEKKVKHVNLTGILLQESTKKKKKKKVTIEEVPNEKEISPEKEQTFGIKPEELTTGNLYEDKISDETPEKKVAKKKKKKPVAKIDEIEEWVEPEYERPVLEPMPEKIQWKPSKKKKETIPLPESHRKLVPIKIERKEIKPTKLKISQPPEAVQFAEIKLKKVSALKRRESKSTKVPKIHLKSRITFISDYSPELQLPRITIFEENPIQNGILDRKSVV